MSSEFDRILKGLPDLGVGLGLRREMHEETLKAKSELKWVEFTPEEFMGANGKSKQRIEEAAEIFPLISHGINLSLGSTDDLNPVYLKELKRLLDRFDVPWWSDHVSFSSAEGIYVNNLLPMSRTRESARHIAERIKKAQDYIERPLLVENISFYMPNPPGSFLTEAEYISEILELADCGMLLDLNNVFVNSINHNFDPYQFLNQIPLHRVVQVHLAGHNQHENMLIDTHSEAVCDPVFDLLDYLLARTMPKGIMIERDGNFPQFSEIQTELARLEELIAKHKGADRKNAAESLTASTAEIHSASTSQKTGPKKKSKSKKQILLSDFEKTFASVVVDKYERHRVLSCIEKCKRSCKCHSKNRAFQKAHADELDLYARITEAGALSAMDCIYPRTKELLGDYYDEAITLYFHEHHQESYILSFLGEKFPQFLHANQERFPLPLAAEMADFEWSRVYVSEYGEFPDQKTKIMSPDFSKDANPNQRIPLLNPTLLIRRYSFAVSDIYDRLSQDDEPGKISKTGEAETVVFYRRPEDNEVIIYSIDPWLASILECIPTIRSYAQLFELLLKRDGVSEPVKQIMEYAAALNRLYSWGMLLGDCAAVEAIQTSSC